MDLRSLTLPVFLAITATIAQYVRLEVKYPFIDEIFHLRQCYAYCAHRFSEWDNKITTPPGLYLLGTGYYHVLDFFGVPNACDQTALRSLNLVAGVLVLPLVLSLVPNSNFWKINVVSLPLLYTYYFLFYTDVWATILVVFSILIVVSKPDMTGALLSSIVGLISLWFRQTNIIWLAFAACLLVDQRKIPGKTTWEQFTLYVVEFLEDLPLLTPYVAVAGLFAVFIKVNGGITLGDKENHQMSLHLVQVFYCSSFLAFFTVPLWFSPTTARKYLKFAVLNNNGANFIMTLASLFAIHYVINNFTVVHPFLLADNRHYTFYLYRKVLSQKYANLVVVPVYHFSSWVVVHMLESTFWLNSDLSLPPFSIVAFVGASIITLIPSPLFEPRYYIVPLVVLRVFSRPNECLTKSQSNMLEFVWYMWLNSVVFIVFFTYEFEWATEIGVQRIIW